MYSWCVPILLWVMQLATYLRPQKPITTCFRCNCGAKKAKSLWSDTKSGSLRKSWYPRRRKELKSSPSDLLGTIIPIVHPSDHYLSLLSLRALATASHPTSHDSLASPCASSRRAYLNAVLSFISLCCFTFHSMSHTVALISNALSHRFLLSHPRLLAWTANAWAWCWNARAALVLRVIRIPAL